VADGSVCIRCRARAYLFGAECVIVFSAMDVAGKCARRPIFSRRIPCGISAQDPFRKPSSCVSARGFLRVAAPSARSARASLYRIAPGEAATREGRGTCALKKMLERTHRALPDLSACARTFARSAIAFDASSEAIGNATRDPSTPLGMTEQAVAPPPDHLALGPDRLAPARTRASWAGQLIWSRTGIITAIEGDRIRRPPCAGTDHPWPKPTTNPPSPFPRPNSR
jgi:hypothetical protein